MAVEIVRGDLVIRAWQAADADELAQVVTGSLDHLRPFMPWIAQEPKSVEDRRNLIAQWRSDEAGGGDQVRGVFLDGVIVGGAGLHRRIGPGGLEIGYWVQKGFVRRGIATAIARSLTDAAFAQPDVDRVEIHHDIANNASSGIPRGLGYHLVGPEPQPIQAPAETGVHCIWRVTRDEWVLAGP